MRKLRRQSCRRERRTSGASAVVQQHRHLQVTSLRPLQSLLHAVHLQGSKRRVRVSAQMDPLPDHHARSPRGQTPASSVDTRGGSRLCGGQNFTRDTTQKNPTQRQLTFDPSGHIRSSDWQNRLFLRTDYYRSGNMAVQQFRPQWPFEVLQPEIPRSPKMLFG